ncbi:hypothetical protein PHLCEN_2v6460 [Hermanssonia centrifuga]|uniref:Uncharacterized protein n=1 Tax=Hermanssonia centrifuga TaxID=98765 RepID=A0A2R6NZV6_9APHY|nr:hypothetical protein PHLCEN_2v6460 [Hermanssonia centrifuga]
MDFDESSNKLVTQEFLAVVLAGFGNEYVAYIIPCLTAHREQAHAGLPTGMVRILRN